MIELAQNAESHELIEALEKLRQEAARLQTVIDTVPSFLWTSLPDGSKEYLNKTLVRVHRPHFGAGARLGLEGGRTP